MKTKPYKQGTYLVSKEELEKDDPEMAVWKVDGPTLLRKYKPYSENGRTMYKKSDIYKAWFPQYRETFAVAPVVNRGNGKWDVRLELLKNKIAY
jgi:hypothetical protein